MAVVGFGGIITYKAVKDAPSPLLCFIMANLPYKPQQARRGHPPKLII